MDDTPILVIPLGSRHYFWHCTNKVFVCNRNRVDIEHEFLRRIVDLWVSPSQSTQSSLWAYSLDVSATITWEAKTEKRVVASASASSVLISIQSCYSDTNIPTHLSASSSKKVSEGGGVHCLVWIFRMSFLACHTKDNQQKA